MIIYVSFDCSWATVRWVACVVASGNAGANDDEPTDRGPNSNYGTVFKLDPTGHETTLHAFSGGSDGRYPTGLIRDVSGKLYGTTLEGGRFGYGTVFVLDQTGRETVRYSFHGKGDGFYPLGNLFQDQVGNLYGVTRYGGDLACNTVGFGTVFKISRNLRVTVLHKFVGSDGVGPVVGLTPDRKGHLWGVANSGGTAGGGGTSYPRTNRRQSGDSCRLSAGSHHSQVVRMGRSCGGRLYPEVAHRQL